MITGNVASNLIGRLISAAVADSFGLAWNFYFFALLNLAGALLVYFTVKRVQPMHAAGEASSPLAAMLAHWRNPQLRAAFGMASASCSDSSAPSPMSISCWCAVLSHSA